MFFRNGNDSSNEDNSNIEVREGFQDSSNSCSSKTIEQNQVYANSFCVNKGFERNGGWSCGSNIQTIICVSGI